MGRVCPGVAGVERREDPKMTLRARIVRGLAGGLLYEALAVVLSMAAMVVLVRLLTPSDYGQAAAAAGILGLIGAFRGAMFAEHAIQHAGEADPDWDACFAIAGIVQAGLAALTVAVAFGVRAVEALAPLSPLLMVGALGFIVDWPAQIASVKLRRELRFERLKFLMGASLVLRLSCAVLLAWIGWGAMALVISGNVLTALPLAGGLFVAGGWRPRRSSFALPAAAQRAAIVQFGRQQIALGLVGSLRAAVDAVVLTNTVGAVGLGLVNRAQALYQTTVGRLGLVFVETIYPTLPREKDDVSRFAVRASRFVEGALILSIPGAVFVALEGRALSRLLYGPEWEAADPLIAPAAFAVAGAALVSAGGRVLMGVGRVRHAVRLEAAAAAAAMASLVVAWTTAAAAPYVWTLAAVQAVCAGLGLAEASPHLASDWRRTGLRAALAASVSGALGVLAVREWGALEGVWGVTTSALVFGALAGVVLTVTARPLRQEIREMGCALEIRRRSASPARLTPIERA